MAQRKSGRKRIKHDAYQTPAWATDAIIPYLDIPKRWRVLEPAAGEGKMVRALRRHGFKVDGSDIQRGKDFLDKDKVIRVKAIVTNPPYNLARKFIERALECTEEECGVVAMLLKVDFDSGDTRRHLFNDHPAFKCKVVLTKRIQWFEGSDGAPSENHAWFIWDWRNGDEPTIKYALSSSQEN